MWSDLKFSNIIFLEGTQCKINKPNFFFFATLGILKLTQFNFVSYQLTYCLGTYLA